MTKLVTILSVIGILALAGQTAYGLSKSQQQELDNMTKACGLSDEQVKKIKDNEETREKELVGVSDALMKGTRAIGEAIKGGDKDKQKAANDEQKKVIAQWQEVTKKYDDARAALMTDGQKATWKGVKEAEHAEQMSRMYTKAYQRSSKDYGGLSDDQIKAMVAIDLARDQAISQFQADNADKIKANQDAMTEAMASRDFEKISQAAAEATKLQAPMTQLYDKTQTDRFALLTAEQKANWLEHTVMQVFSFQLSNFSATDEQKATIMEACAVLCAQKGATIESVRSQLVIKLMNLVTNEQKSKWLVDQTAMIAQGSYFAAKLTDDQNAKIKEACDKMVTGKGTQFVAPVKDLPGMFRLSQEIREKLTPQVESMLSNEQKAAQAKWTQEHTITTRPTSK